MTVLLACVLSVLAIGSAEGAVIIVKADGTGDYPTIQDAIDDANDGDEIICEDGVYTNDHEISFLGKAITVRSENGPENCIIDRQGGSSQIRFVEGEDANSVLQGFTIKNYGGSYGAIRCGSASSPTIIDCVLTNNASFVGAIDCVHSSPAIINCVITNNSLDRASGIWCEDSNAVISGCRITGNNRYGIYSDPVSRPIISNCTITNNGEGGVVNWFEWGSATISNCIIRGNAEEEIFPDSNFVVTYSNVKGGFEGEGNIDIEPLLTPDGHLTAGSACINAGDPNGDYTSQVDIDGEGRVSGGRVDMGCDEFIDTDADGLPDFWESRYFGSATAAGPEDDPDGDGLTNIVEYEVYSSDPTTAAVTYYVDVNGGDDSYDGLAPEWNGVHGPKQTIQAGIDTAASTDTVIVAPGEYLENITFGGKGITVRSSEPGDWEVVKNTIIDGSEGEAGCEYSCVVFDNYEDRTSILDGFTLTKGEGSCAVFAHRDRTLGPSPVYGVGGGILCLHSSPVIKRCFIFGNGIEDPPMGGGMAILGDCQALISNCIIVNNMSEVRIGGGSGILIRSNRPETAINTIENCTIASNVSDYYYANRYQVDCWDSPTIIRNTIIWPGPLERDPCDYPPLEEVNYERCLLMSEPSLVSYSCIRESYYLPPRVGDEMLNLGQVEWFDLTLSGGNTDNGPFFVQPLELSDEDYDHHLSYNSASCINAGDPNYSNEAGEKDIDGQSRIMGGRVDIGADEVVPEIVVTRPATGDVWVSGSGHKIKWESWGCNGPLDISYSTNGGMDWDAIDTGVSDTGSYMWSLPEGVDSNQCVVSVESADVNVVCSNSGMFTIHPDFYHPAVGSTWKSLGNDFNRSGLSEDAGPELGCLKWQFETSGPVTAGVTIGADNRVHIACEDGRLYTLDSEGALLWSYDANTPLLSSPTVGHDGSVYVGGLDKKLYAIAINGSLRWTHMTDGFVYSSPAISDDGEVYACSEDGTIYALGADGSELWEFETAGVGSASGAIFASPAIGTDGDVYVGSVYEPNLYALDGNDGSVKWVCHFEDACDANFGGNWPFASPVVAADGTIYQTLLYSPKRYVLYDDIVEGFWYEAKLYAIDPNNGDIIWDSNMSDTAREREEIPGPNVEPEFYWFEQYYVDIYEEGWHKPPYPYTLTYLNNRLGRYYRVSGLSFSSCALGPDGTIYVSFDDPYLRAVDPNGTMKWVSRLGMVGGPTLAVGSDGLIYAASHDGYLSVVNSSGEEVARFKGEEGLSLSYPAIASDGSLIVSDANNTVWAIGDGDCEGEVSVLHRIEDLDGSGGIDFIDFANIAADWMLNTECNKDLFYYYYDYYAPPDSDCPGEGIYLEGDMDRNLYNEMIDISMLADKWLSED